MAKNPVAFLGPEGTFAHLAARKRFSKETPLRPFTPVKAVFDYVAGDNSRRGVVPIENSSGGTIYQTVDRLIDPAYRLIIQESLSVNVRLALLGRDLKSIRIIYSHFAPLHHCEAWIKTNFPDAKLEEEPSTGIAVEKAAARQDAAAIGFQDAGQSHGLKVLKFPIQEDIENVTHFLVLGHSPSQKVGPDDRTTLIFTLANEPGALVRFLDPFDREGVNLARIISRPIIGKPETYVFLLDLIGTPLNPKVKTAIQKASSVAREIRNIGSYPVRPRFES